MKLKMIWILGILSFVLLPVIASFAEEQTDPVPQLSVPCEVTDVYDGDTLWVMVRVPIKVRLLDCWAPEIKGTKGAEHQAALASRDHLKEISLGKRGLLVVPLTELRSIGDLFSFDRILGRVYVDHPQRDVSVEQVKNKHATKDRPPNAGNE